MSPEARGRSFDELSRGLASGTLSRGKALKLMGAALVGGALGSLGGVAAADEECKPLNKKCRKNHQCCSNKCEGGKCAPACTATGGTCGSNADCCSGFCVDRICHQPRALGLCECAAGQGNFTCGSDCAEAQVLCQNFCAAQGSTVLSFGCDPRSLC